VRERFPYAFSPGKAYGGGVPQFDAREIHAAEPFDWENWRIVPLPVQHGPEPILGYRVGNFALITDVTVIPEATLAKLEGLDVLALDCLRRAPHSTHLHLDGAIEYALRIKAKRTFMVHLAHDLDHAETEKALPPGCAVAYDGLELEL
jgi:phosphoribosyl 1,2-cyclic phosphate phosphodiesterase